MLAVAVIATSCDPDAESYTAGEQDPAGCQGMYFAGNYNKTVEVEPGVSSFEVTLARTVTDAAGTVDLEVVNNEENVFICPSSVSFAAGEATKNITIEVQNAKEGVNYNLMLAVAGDNVSLYTDGYRETSIDFAILKWESIGYGYWIDGLVGTFFGVEQLPLAVEVEKTNTATSLRYRFNSPYASVMTGICPNGLGYIGYPYNAPEEVVAGEYLFIIDITSAGVTLKPVGMGMNWGYGDFSTGTIYGNISNKIESYPLGIYHEEEGYVEFPESSLYCDMSEYGTYPALECLFFTSAEAYLNYLNPEGEGGEAEGEEGAE